MKNKQTTILGLTGSIGMGKSTTAQMFSNRGIPVWDADSTVHRLYKTDVETIAIFQKDIPEAVFNNRVSRNVLRRLIMEDDKNLRKIEKITHPLVAKDRLKFIKESLKTHTPLIVLDIPLLFETGSDQLVDFTVVVTVDFETQKRRVLGRESMTLKMFESILNKQLSDKEKQIRADFVVSTKSLNIARKKVDEIILQFGGG